MPFSSSPSGQPADDVAKDVTLANFKAEVITVSQTTLVLVAFWAPWEASSKQLNAMLEKLARSSKGAFKLAKIDIDRNQPIVQQMGVQEIPAVYAIHKGRPVDAFSGILPEAQVKAWIDQILKTTGTGGEEKASLDAALKQAEEHLSAGDSASARAIYSDILGTEPENAQAYAGLVRCLIDEGDVLKAREMLDKAPVSMAKDKAFDSVRASIELAEQVRQSRGQTAEIEAKLAQNPTDHQARFDLALAYYASGRNEDAVDQLLDIVRRARTWNDDAARKQLVKLFEAFGVTSPLTISARKRLSSILFS